jgi:hypothetical protein
LRLVEEQAQGPDEVRLEGLALDDVVERKALKPYIVRALRLFLNKPQ